MSGGVSVSLSVSDVDSDAVQGYVEISADVHDSVVESETVEDSVVDSDAVHGSVVDSEAVHGLVPVPVVAVVDPPPPAESS